jgi:methanogenic corrinoid protein MtbC1
MAIYGVPQDDVGRRGGPESGPGVGQAMEDPCAVGIGLSAPHLQGLVRAVEGEIVPRLLLARRQLAPPVEADDAACIETGDADELARLLISHEVDVPFAYVESIRYRGVSVRDIYIRLLAPTARRLGTMWEEDETDFLQVTLALGRLHQLLQRISLLTPGPESLESRGNGRRALLATVPGEDHSFGIMMVSQFFRQNGWEVWNEFPGCDQDLANCVKAHSFAIVGLSAGSTARMDAVASAVRAVRRTSINAAVGVIVGGPLFNQHPEFATRVGADATASDGEQAARLAESVCALLTGEK